MMPLVWAQAAMDASEKIVYGFWAAGLICLGVLLVAVVVACKRRAFPVDPATTLHYASRRRETLSGWAAAHGLSFKAAEDISGLEKSFPFLQCLQRGESHYASNLMQGDWGGSAMVGFDYHCLTGAAESRFSVVIIASRVLLQPLLIRPRSLLDNVSESLGAEAVNFESAEFNHEFRVKATDKRWAYDVIHPRMMKFLLGNPRFIIEFAFAHVACYRNNEFTAANFGTACEVACGILDRLPEYVLLQQRQPENLGRGES